MHRSTLKIAFVLLVGLFFLISTPKSVQNAWRSSFLRPILPLSRIVPFTKKPSYSSCKTYASPKPDIIPSNPNATIAKVIYRHPSTWNDFFWIDLGKEANKEQKKIMRFSPVLYEGRLIGLVDYVSDKQSRVQLITNSNCTISVRAVRGQLQYEPLYEAIHLLKTHPHLENESSLQDLLTHTQEKLLQNTYTSYLAKGELFGRGEPLWRSNATLLKGRGFQCEHEDSLSAQRDLLTGCQLKDRLAIQVPILEKGDLLVTTGFDGIFPPGIEVARVLEVENLVEGAFAYDLTAIPLAPRLKDLNFVEVILPLEYQSIHPALPAFED